VSIPQWGQVAALRLSADIGFVHFHRPAELASDKRMFERVTDAVHHEQGRSPTRLTHYQKFQVALIINADDFIGLAREVGQ
jgi:hypothetical protein